LLVRRVLAASGGVVYVASRGWWVREQWHDASGHRR
jgi:hypothetical protein